MIILLASDFTAFTLKSASGTNCLCHGLVRESNFSVFHGFAEFRFAPVQVRFKVSRLLIDLLHVKL